MSSTRTHLPIVRSAVLAMVLTGTAIGGFASTASAGAPDCEATPAACTITTAPPVSEPHPGDNPDLPVTDGPNPTHPGDDPDLPVADKPKGEDPGDGPDKPVADKPTGDKPEGGEADDQDAPAVQPSTVDAPVVAAANFTG